MTKNISPSEVYLKYSLPQLLEQAENGGRLQYNTTDKAAKFRTTNKGNSYNTDDLISATFQIGDNQYKYDNLFKPTLNIDTGDTIKDYELVDGKFRLTRYSDVTKSIDYEYTYSDDGKSVEKTTIKDGEVTSTGFLPIAEQSPLANFFQKDGR